MSEQESRSDRGKTVDARTIGTLDCLQGLDEPIPWKSGDKMLMDEQRIVYLVCPSNALTCPGWIVKPQINDPQNVPEQIVVGTDRLMPHPDRSATS